MWSYLRMTRLFISEDPTIKDLESLTKMMNIDFHTWMIDTNKKVFKKEEIMIWLTHEFKFLSMEKMKKLEKKIKENLLKRIKKVKTPTITQKIISLKEVNLKRIKNF